MLVFTYEVRTPELFVHVRGSSNVVLYRGNMYCLVHIVTYTSPRKYYHMLVRMNPETKQPMAYTAPFYFRNNAVEYTLGMDIRDGKLSTIVSQNDMNPVVATIDMREFRFITL
jgi:hypothetical protein